MEEKNIAESAGSAAMRDTAILNRGSEKDWQRRWPLSKHLKWGGGRWRCGWREEHFRQREQPVQRPWGRRLHALEEHAWGQWARGRTGGDEAGGIMRAEWPPETPVRSLASFLSEGGHLWKMLTRGIVGSDFFPFFSPSFFFFLNISHFIIIII